MSFFGYELKKKRDRLEALEIAIAPLDSAVVAIANTVREHEEYIQKLKSNLEACGETLKKQQNLLDQQDIKIQNLCKEFVTLNKSYQNFEETFVQEISKVRAAANIKSIFQSSPLFAPTAVPGEETK